MGWLSVDFFRPAAPAVPRAGRHQPSGTPAEKNLALTLDANLHDVAVTLEPHRLCGYLYDVASAFTRFYDACPVLKAEDPATRDNRIALADLTGRTLATGLNLLGITASERL